MATGRTEPLEHVTQIGGDEREMDVVPPTRRKVDSLVRADPQPGTWWARARRPITVVLQSEEAQIEVHRLVIVVVVNTDVVQSFDRHGLSCLQLVDNAAATC